MSKQALFFVYVWPEAVSSAAGVRTRALVSALLNTGWTVACASPSGPSRFSEELNALGVATITCDPNRSQDADEKLKSAFGGVPATLVIYDRFVMEEQFGWRTRALFPNALHLVDTQDLHCVRRGREKLAGSSSEVNWEKILNPSTEDLGEDLLRELASLYRSDAALVVSSWEEKFLLSLGFPSTNLLHLAFPSAVDKNVPSFEERSGFCFLGNYRHAPNLDSVKALLASAWPKLRERMPHAELHLYGSYPPSEISQHKGKNGVFAHGPIADHRAALRKHRALLAPLRFGAGIKGKVLESWGTGTPVVGSPLTFEGMGAEGLIARTDDELIEACVAVHEEKNVWEAQSALGLRAVKESYGEELLASMFLRFIDDKTASLTKVRAANLTGAMLRHHQQNGTKYFSKWIEAKNSAR